MKVAAQLAELSLDEFKALNPQFNRPIITGGANTRILLPQDNAEKFKPNLAEMGPRLVVVDRAYGNQRTRTDRDHRRIQVQHHARSTARGQPHPARCASRPVPPSWCRKPPNR